MITHEFLYSTPTLIYCPKEQLLLYNIKHGIIGSTLFPF